MGTRHLVCASCAHPVEEGRCAVCRDLRESLVPVGPSAATVVVLAVVLLLLTAVLATCSGG